MSARSLWVVLTRPDNLPLAVAVAEALRDRFPGGVHLVRENSAWWERVKWRPQLRARFDQDHVFDRIPACRGLRDLPRLVRQTLARQRALGCLPAGPEDVAVCLAGLVGLANAVASAWSRAGRGRPTLLVPRKKWDDLRRPIDHWRFRWTTAGWLANRLVEPLSGLRPSVHLKSRCSEGGDGVRLVRYVSEPGTIFAPVIVLSNAPAGSNLGTGVNEAPFPNLALLGETLGLDEGGPPGKIVARKVLFFGTPFLLVRNLVPTVYAEGVNRCLDYLRRHYPGCELVYHPHPSETTEAGWLRLEGFRVETDGELAEMIFLKQVGRIAAVYSVSSTVSRVALGAGLEAYCLWRTFPFSPLNAAYFETLMGTVPPEFDVRDLSEPPVRYAARYQSGGKAFAEVLRTMILPPPAAARNHSSHRSATEAV